MRQFRLGAAAKMADDFGSAQTAQFAASGKRQTAGQAVEKPARVKIACPGRVDDASDWRRIDFVLRTICQDDTACCAARQRGNRHTPAHRRSGGGKVVSLVKRANLGLIGKEDVDVLLDEVAECGAVPPDTKRVG